MVEMAKNTSLFGLPLLRMGAVSSAEEMERKGRSELQKTSQVILAMIEKEIITGQEGSNLLSWAHETDSASRHSELCNVYAKFTEVTREVCKYDDPKITSSWKEYLQTIEKYAPAVRIEESARCLGKRFPLSIAMCSNYEPGVTTREIAQPVNRRDFHEWMHTVASQVDPKIMRQESTKNLLESDSTHCITASMAGIQVGGLVYNKLDVHPYGTGVVVWGFYITPEAAEMNVTEALLQHLFSSVGNKPLVLCRVHAHDAVQQAMANYLPEEICTRSKIFGNFPVRFARGAVSDNSAVHLALSKLSNHLGTLAEEKSLVLRIGRAISSQLGLTRV